MIAEQPIPELGRVTASAITEVLATQFNLLATASTPGDKPVTGIPEQCLRDSATLCGGPVAGDVHLQLPEAFATKLTALLLGRSATSATDESAADWRANFAICSPGVSQRSSPHQDAPAI